MKCKYKKFLKAAYINYEEDYCSNAMLRPIVQPVYLTQWKIAGNSEVHGDELWYCGEYNATDGKYHILVQPQGGSIADIALTEPLRKIKTIVDTIEFPSDTDGKAFVTRRLSSILIGNAILGTANTISTGDIRIQFNNITAKPVGNTKLANILCSSFKAKTNQLTYSCSNGISVSTSGIIMIYDPDYNTDSDINDFKADYADTEVIYELTTPTTELVDAPQIAEAESYTCVTIPGSKALSWSSFETE